MLVTALLRGLLELRLGRRKVWHYFFDEDKRATDFCVWFTIAAAVLTAGLLAGVLPPLLHDFAFYLLVPFLVALSAKGVQEMLVTKRRNKEEE